MLSILVKFPVIFGIQYLNMLRNSSNHFLHWCCGIWKHFNLSSVPLPYLAGAFLSHHNRSNITSPDPTSTIYNTGGWFLQFPKLHKDFYFRRFFHFFKFWWCQWEMMTSDYRRFHENFHDRLTHHHILVAGHRASCIVDRRSSIVDRRYSRNIQSIQYQ